MLTLLDTIIELAKDAINSKEQHGWVLCGSFAAIAYAGSFIGTELFLVYLHGLIKHQREGISESIEHQRIVVVILGCFKGKTGERYYLTPLAAKTQSGLEVQK
eukprot:12922754-Ditylum_brightwellii.AAC.1